MSRKGSKKVLTYRSPDSKNRQKMTAAYDPYAMARNSMVSEA